MSTRDQVHGCWYPAKRWDVLTCRDADWQERGGGAGIDVQPKKLPAMNKIGELNIMRSFLPDFSASSCSLFGKRLFHRTKHAFCMTHHQAIVMGERHSESEAG
jgi:hypothetical protein